jgi:hypothetical protein
MHGQQNYIYSIKIYAEIISSQYGVLSFLEMRKSIGMSKPLNITLFCVCVLKFYGFTDNGSIDL